MLVAAVEHGSGLVLGQLEIASKTNEIPAVRDLADAVAISGRADYVVTAIKDNQPTMLADLQGMDFSDSPACETLDKGHGRIERERHVLKTGATSTAVTYALTLLTADRATAEQLAALVRNHWHIENRLHYVRDFTYDEDRCRVYVRDLPRNLACLTNTAISIVRCQSDFQYLPEANRHFADRPQEALDLLLSPPAR